MNFWLLPVSHFADLYLSAAPLSRAPLNHSDPFKSGLEKQGELIVFFLSVVPFYVKILSLQANLSLLSGSAGFNGN